MNAVPERVNQVIIVMVHITEIDMANSVTASDIATFLTNVAYAIQSTYYTVLKALPGAAFYGWATLLDIPFLADWNKIGDHRQCQKDLKTLHDENMAGLGLQNW